MRGEIVTSQCLAISASNQPSLPHVPVEVKSSPCPEQHTPLAACQNTFGPDTPYSTHVVPDYVYDMIPFDVDREMFDVIVRFRWLYIMFGQTFTTSSGICAIWDFILPRFTNIYRVAAALLAHAVRECQAEDKCSLERLSDLVSLQIHSDAAVAEIIACAQAI